MPRIITASDFDDLAEVAKDYVCECGEGHPDVPVSADLAWEIKNFDGSTRAVDSIWARYRAGFKAKKASRAFLAYARKN